LSAESSASAGVVLGGGGRDDREHGAAGQRVGVVQREQVTGVDHGEQQRTVLEADRQDAVLTADAAGQQGDRRPVHRDLVEVDERHPGLLGQQRDQLRLGERPTLDEHPAERRAGGGLLVQGGEQSRLVHQATVEEDLSELHHGHAFPGDHGFGVRRRGVWARARRISGSGQAVRSRSMASCTSESNACLVAVRDRASVYSTGTCAGIVRASRTSSSRCLATPSKQFTPTTNGIPRDSK
jgi:hypothetical protein